MALFHPEKNAEMDRKLFEDFHDPAARARRRKNVRIGFCTTLALLVLASVLNWGVVTGWGAVRIDRLKLLGPDGAELSALIYTPKGVTDEYPAPGILMFHGNAGNARNHESWAVEMSRRGFVVLSVDQFGAGDSQGYFDGGETGALSGESLLQEADLFYAYMLNLPFVDTKHIVSSGHSMGNTAAALLGARHNANLVFAASPVILAMDDMAKEYKAVWDTWTGNYIATNGEFEASTATADKGGQAEIDKRVGEGTPWEPNRLYGSFAEGNAYAYIIEHRIHEAAFVSRTSIGHLIEYALLAVGDAVPNPLEPSNQIWMYKDYTGLLGTCLYIAFLCALALLLMEEIPALSFVRRPLAKNKGLQVPGIYISIALGLIFPYIVLKTDAFGLVGGSHYANLLRLGFNMGYSNMAFGTMVGIASLGVLGFLLYFFTDGLKQGFTLSDSGLTQVYERGGDKGEGWLSYFFKTLLLSCLVIGIGWAYILGMETVLGTSFYSWFFGIKEIPLVKIPYYWNYLLVWILCFVVSNLGINVERRLPTTGSETLDTVVAIIFNILVVTFTITLVVIVKWVAQTEGSPIDTNFIWNMGLDTQRIWGMPVGMACGIGGSTFLYKKTGNTWLCAILMGTVCCLMCMLFGGSRFHFATFYV